ncbi:hypothetical protein D3C72_2396480 [compost metagenome]
MDLALSSTRFRDSLSTFSGFLVPARMVSMMEFNCSSLILAQDGTYFSWAITPSVVANRINW